MGYAINQQNGMRAVDSENDLLDGETYQDELPTPWPPAAGEADNWADYQRLAKAALEDTSTTVERIIEAVSLGKTTFTTEDVVTYMQYRADLRAILSEAQPEVIPSSLPAKPAYPANT